MRMGQSFVSSYSNYWFVFGAQLSANDRFYGNLYDGTNNPFISGAASSVTADTWYHLVFIRNTSDDKIYLYVNGTEVTSGTGVTDSTTSVPTYSTFSLGSGNSSTEFTNGTIDEVGIWSRALTSSEVTELYNSGDGFAYPFVAAGTNTQINIGDDWKEIDAMKINIADDWKVVASIKQNIGDSWKTVF